MKIACLGAGAWGIALADLLAKNGHWVYLWTKNNSILESIVHKREHPQFPGLLLHENIFPTNCIEEALFAKDAIVESVTSKGFRKVLEEVLRFDTIEVPFILSSKGIEPETELLVPEIAFELLEERYHANVVYLSGPSIAKEVLYGHPTSVIAASYSLENARFASSLFSNNYFQVYPDLDIIGVAFGGAMKNIIAIACGIATGLGFGDNTKAALMTRGIEEMKKLAALKPMRGETLHGLSGFGDLCVTCQSQNSRNNTFGKLIGQGHAPKEARAKVGMVVEGELSSKAAFFLSKKHNIYVPIVEAIYKITQENIPAKQLFEQLFLPEYHEISPY